MNKKRVSNSKIKILVVEDNPVAQRMANLIFKSLDCKIDIASNRGEALNFFKNCSYNLVFMDIGLPDETGFNIVRELRDIEKKTAPRQPTPILGLSVHTVETARAQALKTGMDGYFVKPITIGMGQSILKQFVKHNS